MSIDTVFLDANILFSAVYRPGASLLRLWKVSGAKLVTSAYVVEEALRNLEGRDQRALLEGLLKDVDVSQVAPEGRSLPSVLDLPDKDRPILLSAINHKATHLLTGDFKHFGRYYGKTVKGVLILPPADYLRGAKA